MTVLVRLRQSFLDKSIAFPANPFKHLSGIYNEMNMLLSFEGGMMENCDQI